MQMEAEQRGKREGEQIGEQRGKQIGRREGEQIGEQRGELKKAKESAKKLYEMGMATKEIAQVVGYPVEEVEEWLGLV
jgi:predicted transposase YdaD